MKLEEFERVFGQFDETVRNSEIVAGIRKELETRQRLAPGRVAPVFSLAQRDGQMLSLADLRGKVVLVDFWAAWCGPCKMLSPVLHEIAEEYAGTVKVGKVNVDEQAELAMRFRVSSIPMLVLFKNGKAVASAVGYRPKAEIAAMLR